MQLDLSPAWVATVFLLSLRIGALVVASPLFSNLASLVVVRVLLTLTLAATLAPVHGGANAAVALSPGALAGAALAEVAVGLVLAFGVHAAFGAFAVAGRIVDTQSGFGLGAVFDPVTRSGSPVFSIMLNLAAAAMFFAVDGHHAFLRGLVFSVQQAPPGGGWTGVHPEAAIRQFGLMFSLGVALIAPVMFGLFLVEVALAVISRVLPQMSVFVVGVPVKIVAALALMAWVTAAMKPSLERVYAAIFTYWQMVLR
jgi:flagellar biosynthesis protein FliR